MYKKTVYIPIEVTKRELDGAILLSLHGKKHNYRTIFGSKEAIFNLDVKLDGTILFPELGSVSVVNETFGEVKLKLNLLTAFSAARSKSGAHL